MMNWDDYYNNNNAIIYESPDQGKTVYARVSGQTERININEPDQIAILRQELIEDQLWQKIRKASKTNDSLRKLLDDAKLLYHLSNKDA